ncbi:MAG: cysteine desulfurase family protein [Kiloniellales bacterium]
MPRSVYLDYNATAPVRPRAAAAVSEALSLTGNASSVHRYGRLARRMVEEAREAVAALVAAEPEQVVFTSGGTEANNLALNTAAGRRILVSAGEHDSILQAVPDGERIPLTADGVVDIVALADLMAREPAPALVSIMLANNETGVVQPVAEAARLARGVGACLHCDAVQAAGKMPVDFGALEVDLLSLSAHKLGGPQGVGALLVRDGVDLPALLHGGGQERRRRPGTENLPGIAGFGAAAREAGDCVAAFADLATWRDVLESAIGDLAPEARIFGSGASRLPNTSCFTMPGVRAETQVMALDLAGVAVSAGSACSSGKVQPSHVLRAMGADEETANSAIRVSLGWASAREDLDSFLQVWSDLLRRAGAAGVQRTA